VESLRVGLDGRAFSSPAAGVRRYVNALVPALRALGVPLDLVVLGGSPRDVPEGMAHVAEPRHPPTNLGWTLVGLPIAARRGRIDLLHARLHRAGRHPDPGGGDDPRRQLRTPSRVVPTAGTGCAGRSIARARDRPRGW
jgi:hypothetical protein